MKPFFIGLGLGVFLLLLFINFGLGSKAGQPISFNHKKHMEQGMECIACHLHFKHQTFSGMPKLAVCLECHKDPITQNPEEEEIRGIHKKTRNPLETDLTAA